MVAMIRSSAAEDRLAIELFTRCQAAGQPIVLGAAEELLGELLAHQPACGCGLCGDAARVRALGVFAVARTWATGISATRQRAAR